MRYEVTRDVVSDLWPLCRAGESSRDSQVLVEAFLAQDAEFAARLETGDQVRRVVPAVHLSPDAELQALQAARQHARTRLLIIGGAVATACILALLSFLGAAFVLFRGAH